MVAKLNLNESIRFWRTPVLNMRVKKIKGHQFSVEIDCNGDNLNFLQEATRNKCHASSNKCLTSSNKDASARQPLAKTVSKLSSEEVLDDVVVWSLKGRQTE